MVKVKGNSNAEFYSGNCLKFNRDLNLQIYFVV